MKIIRFFNCFICALSLLLFTDCGSGKVYLNSYAREGQDVSDILQSLVNKRKQIIIGPGTWIISKPIYLRSNVSIEGTDKDRCIIKASEETLMRETRRFTLFTTVEIKNPISIVRSRNLQEKEYGRKMISSVSIKNLSFDMNRHPERFKAKGKTLRAAEVSAVRFENCRDCIVDDCNFTDYCIPEGSPDWNNSSPMICVVKSSNCVISNCSTRNCTFVSVVGSSKITVTNNNGTNSVGTWVETMGGEGHIISGNSLSEVFWRVSSIGVNSINCEIANNVIDNPVGDEISCLTLGHNIKDPSSLGYYEMSAKADGAYVHDNRFTTAGTVGILVQSGSNLILENNYVKCRQERDDCLTCGALSFRGENDNFKNVRIVGNTFQVDGAGKGNVILGINLDNAHIIGNTIEADCKTAITVYDETSHVEIKGNKITNKGQFIIGMNRVHSLEINENEFVGGTLAITCDDIEMKNNTWKSMSATAYFKRLTKDAARKVDIEGNTFMSARNKNIKEKINVK